MMLRSSIPVPITRKRRVFAALGSGALLAFVVPLALLPLRFAAFAKSGDAPYTAINGDTGKPWAAYPDASPHINFGDGLARWEQGKSDKAHSYVIGVAKPKAPTDGPSVFLQAVSPTEGEYGVLMQHVRPGAFRGKRVRFSGWVKTFWVKTAVHGAGFWLRMDTPTWQRAWNKLSAPLTGTRDWTKLSYVFDVPGDAQGFSFGINLAGSGTANLHDPTFEVVDKSIPVSAPAFDSSPEANTAKPEAPTDRSFVPDFDNPTNLDFKSGLAGWWNDNPDHNATQGYAIALDNNAALTPGETAAVLKSITASPQSYGTLAQNTQAKSLRGKRVRMTTYLKTENAQAAGYWIVVHAGDNATGFNRTANPIKGTTGWTKYEAVLEIPRDAEGISFGLDLTGTGKVWTDGFAFEVLGDASAAVPKTPASTKSTGSSERNPFSGVNWNSARTHPSNLDFATGLTDWDKTAPGGDAPDYEAGVDNKALRPGGKAAPAFLRAIKASPKSYGALMQGIQAGDFRNHRVRFSGFIKTKSVRDARLFLRMDTKHGVSAWNMGKKPVEGTTGWMRVEFVFDVPADADGMAYGVSLHGPGQVWADGFQLETVASDVPVTPEPGG